MNRIEKITIILANLVTVIQKRGDYNLDEYSNKIAALYSSQEPQKVVCPDCDGKGNHLLASMGTAKVCSKCNGTGKVSQSVSTPTEGMELSSDDIDHEFIKYPQLKPPGVTLYCCIKDILRLQVAKVLSNLPEQEIRESERKEIGSWLKKQIQANSNGWRHVTLSEGDVQAFLEGRVK